MLFIQAGECVEGVVQGNHVRTPHLRQDERGVELDPTVGAALGRATAASVIHQNLPHQAGSNGKKMRAILGIKRPLVKQPQIGLVDECCALQSMFGALAPQMAPGDVAQLFIDQRDQRFQRLLVARLPAHE